jgi:creatinine amidohydrolase
VVTDVAALLRLSGVQRLLLVNGHGGNYVLSNIVQESVRARPTHGAVPNRG